MTECIFGWGKQHGTMRKAKHRGIAAVAADLMLNLIAYNLVRIPKLIAAGLAKSACKKSPTGRIVLTNIDEGQATLIAYYGARNLLICRCRRRTSTNSPSTSRPPRRSALACRNR